MCLPFHPVSHFKAKYETDTWSIAFSEANAILYSISFGYFTLKINPERVETKLIRLNLVNIMFVDALAHCVARSSVAMILTV